MWKWTRKNENRPKPPGLTSSGSTAPRAIHLPLQEPVHKISESQSIEDLRPDVSHIGKSIVIKGELSGSENVYLDGELEGSIDIRGGDLAVGPNGCIRANLEARNIVVEGRVNGNLHGCERVELRKSAAVVGDILAQRVAIEDGAQLKGSVLVPMGSSSSQATKAEKEPLAGGSEFPRS